VEEVGLKLIGGQVLTCLTVYGSHHASIELPVKWNDKCLPGALFSSTAQLCVTSALSHQLKSESFEDPDNLRA
jgi:hypothetical protein